MDDVERHESIFPMGCQVSSKGRWRFCRGSPAAPKWIYRGEGAMVYDLDKREFLDLTAGLGAITIGHNRSRIFGVSCFPLPSPAELSLADQIQHMIPWAHKMRFLKNGGDATSAAVRLARIYTGRDRVLDLGNYHGCQDPWITDDHEGVPPEVRRLTIRKPAQIKSIEYAEELGDHFACVILEAAPLNPLPPEFLKELRAYCDRSGTVLIFDDVISGFRAHPQGAAGLSGIHPDLTCAGKAMANGWPISVVYGNPDIMDCWSRTHLSATHWAEPDSMCAAVENLMGMRHANHYGANFWEAQAAWTFGNQPSNGHWSVVQLPPDEQTYVQLLLLRMGIISNLSMFFYLALAPHKERVEQAFAEALGKLADAKSKGVEITSLLDCEVNRTVFRRN